jgi:hypothetical protein
MKLQYIAPLLAAGAAAVAIAAAPTAFATARELSACPAMFRSRHPPGVQHYPGDVHDLTVQDFAPALGLAT